jgi:uncharacterized protein (TIGR01777 family)
MRIIIFGGTGFIGSYFIEALESKDYEIVVVTRNPGLSGSAQKVTFVGYKDSDLTPLFSGNYAVVNLAGAGIADKLWTPARKRHIINSRVKVTERISELISNAIHPPKVILQASAVGYYGARGEDRLTESSEAGSGFLPEVVDRWEKTLKIKETSGTRKVILRTGLVLGKKGLMQKLVPVFKMYLGGYIGNGKQWMPWIHVDDQIGAMLFLLTHSKAKGVFNLVSPNPARMKDLTKTLGKVLRRPSWAPIPSFIFRLIPYGFGKELVLTSQHVIPQKLNDLDYKFHYSDLEKALSNLFSHA